MNVALSAGAGPGRGFAGRVWWIYLVVGLVAVAAYRGLASLVLGEVLYLVLGASAVAAILFGIRLHQPVRRAPWYVLAANQLLWVLGDLAAMLVSHFGDPASFPTVGDAFYLAGYPVLALSLFLLTRDRRPAHDLEGLLDGATISVGLLLLCWVLLAAPSVSIYADSPLAAFVAAGYPLLDVGILAMLVALVTTPGSRTVSLRVLVTALALVMVADTAAAGLDLLTFGSTADLDPLWLVSSLLAGVAVLHPSVRVLSVPMRPDLTRFSQTRVVATMVAVLVAPATLLVEHLAGVRLDVWPIALASAVMFLLVVARMNLAIREIAAAEAQRARAQAQLAYQASHDSLTGLPNRAQALALIKGSLARASRSGAAIGMLFVDLDGFKGVNDTYGHSSGDELLREVADRMQQVVRAGDVVGRLGGDEFVVLLEPVVETESAVVVAERMIAAISEPVELTGGYTVRVGASVGVAVSQDLGVGAETLLNEADTAAYRAKAMGRGRAEVFDSTVRRELAERSALEAALRTAIATDALLIRYRPVVQIDTGRALGYETVLSWDRPGVGLVDESQFRPTAELSDLVFELDNWVLERATRQLARWNVCAGHDRLALGVDLAARHLARARVLEDIRVVLQATAIAPHQLILEITDTTFVDDPIGFGHLDQLRELGVRVGLDDFGAGYSSVRRLQRLPIDVVKLHGSFLEEQSSTAGLLPLMVKGVQNFKLPLVVQGVADEAQLEVLRKLDCDAAQGLYFGADLTADQVTELLSVVSVAS